MIIFKKIILILILMCIIVYPIFALTGTYTTHDLFYRLSFGAFGQDEHTEYVTYLEIADAQIWANKLAFGSYYPKTEIDTLGEVETIYSKNITDSDELATALTDYYLKTAIDTLGEVETIYSKDIIDSDELAALKFTDLDDTPANYTGGSLKFVRVNEGETALEFAAEADPTVDTDAKIKAILVDEVTKTGDFTAGRIAKINNATGIIEQGTNTDTDVADAITKKHTQNTDTAAGGEWNFGAYSAGFTLQSTTGDGTTTIDWRLGNKFKFTFGAQNETFTFTAPTNSCTLMLTLIQDGTGSRTVTWPATVKWPGGTAPTLTTTANARDKVALDWDGTQYDGVASLDFK